MCVGAGQMLLVINTGSNPDIERAALAYAAGNGKVEA